MTQEQLSKKLGVTNKTVSRWENGNYMPDLSLLIPLSECLDITLNELLNGEEINEQNEKVENSLKITLNYSKKKIRNLKIILFIMVGIIILFTMFIIFNHQENKYYDGDVSKWENNFLNHSAYEMALNEYSKPVFKNPDKALKKAKSDYSDAIKVIKEQFTLLPLTKHTYESYKNYGWQIETDDLMIKEQGRKLSSFLDIYENSFE